MPAETDVAMAGQVGEMAEQKARQYGPRFVSAALDLVEPIVKSSGYLVAPVAMVRDEEGNVQTDEEGNPYWEYGQAGGIGASFAMFAYAWWRTRRFRRELDEEKEHRQKAIDYEAEQRREQFSVAMTTAAEAKTCENEMRKG